MKVFWILLVLAIGGCTNSVETTDSSATTKSNPPPSVTEAKTGHVEEIVFFATHPGSRPSQRADIYDDIESASQAAGFDIVVTNGSLPQSLALKSTRISKKRYSGPDNSVTSHIDTKIAQLVYESDDSYFYLVQLWWKPGPDPLTGDWVVTRDVSGVETALYNLGDRKGQGPVRRVQWYNGGIEFGGWTNLSTDDAFAAAKAFIDDPHTSESGMDIDTLLYSRAEAFDKQITGEQLARLKRDFTEEELRNGGFTSVKSGMVGLCYCRNVDANDQGHGQYQTPCLCLWGGPDISSP